MTDEIEELKEKLRACRIENTELLKHLKERERRVSELEKKIKSFREWDKGK